MNETQQTKQMANAHINREERLFIITIFVNIFPLKFVIPVYKFLQTFIYHLHNILGDLAN